MQHGSRLAPSAVAELPRAKGEVDVLPTIRVEGLVEATELAKELRTYEPREAAARCDVARRVVLADVLFAGPDVGNHAAVEVRGESDRHDGLGRRRGISLAAGDAYV